MSLNATNLFCEWSWLQVWLWIIQSIKFICLSCIFDTSRCSTNNPSLTMVTYNPNTKHEGLLIRIEYHMIRWMVDPWKMFMYHNALICSEICSLVVDSFLFILTQYSWIVSRSEESLNLNWSFCNHFVYDYQGLWQDFPLLY